MTEVQGYTARWAAPEVLESGDRNTPEADTFTFAMVMIEVGVCVSTFSVGWDTKRKMVCLTLSKVFTRKAPFSEFTATVTISKIIDGERPDRPQEPGLADSVWDVTCVCWSQNPAHRPAIMKVDEILREWLVNFLFTESPS